MNTEFKRPVLEDRDIIMHYFSLQKSRSCECTFSCVYLWSRFYYVEYAILEDMMVFKCGKENPFFDFPYGEEKNVKAALEAIKAYCKKENLEFKLGLVTPAQFEILEKLYPDTFEITYDRDSADYVYEREKLANLSGKKYHGKKNHVNKFKKTYPDWIYESITDENVEDCFQMALGWRNANDVDEDDEKNAEMTVAMNSLRLFKELGLRGGLLRVNGEVVAFSMGEPVCDDTMVVHIEKARADIEGAYAMINQQFVLHETDGFTYINREDDVGEEGLRKAKLSYHPVFMVEKGNVTYKK